MPSLLRPDPWHLDEPFWRSHRVYGESLFFIRETPSELPSARLLFSPAGPLVLTSASREITFSSGTDYLVDAGTRVVTLPPGSRTPFRERASLYPGIGDENCMPHKRGNDQVGLYFGEGHLFHDQQVEATYAHHSLWNGFVPPVQLDQLPGTARKLKETGPLKISVIGDSISTGCNASGLTGVAPGMPPYTGLLTETLGRHGKEVILSNHAVSGTGMKYGLDVMGAVAKELPDLVLLAYGMNDVGFNPVADYLSQAGEIIRTIKQQSPETEFILVASMLGNPEWVYTPLENFGIFRNALDSLCGEGIVLADLTRVWAELLKLKSYHDLTGNGVNHPNDFGHRIYAQVLLDLLGFGTTGN